MTDLRGLLLIALAEGGGATMILRRVTQHVRDLNWTAIGIDFMIAALSGVDS